MTIEEKIEVLQTEVSQFVTESFAGFLAYYIKYPPDEVIEKEITGFDSRLKDFLYLIALHSFSEKRGNNPFRWEQLPALAEKLRDIKKHYRAASSGNHTLEAVLHEIAFCNYFDNGSLSYVEQDLEKLRTIFSPFERQIQIGFGLDIDSCIEIYKASEIATKIRMDQAQEFAHTKEYKEVFERVSKNEMTVKEGYDSLPAKVQEGWLNHMEKRHIPLLFTREDLYRLHPEEKVDNFLKLLSCKLQPNKDFKYYSDQNPLQLTPILELSENRFLHIGQKQIPIALYNHFYNYLIGKKDLSSKVSKHRDKSLEQKVKAIFQSFFGTKDTYYYENYYVHKSIEQDLLILKKGTALIIEIKASKLQEPFRNIEKALVRIKHDFRDSIQYGYDQCYRVEKLFYQRDKFSIQEKNGKVLYEIYPKKYHTVYSIVVTLERFGPLQTDLNLLLKKEEQQNFPWSIYIDDLETFLLTLKKEGKNRQSRLIDFIGQRIKLNGRTYAIDELDICGAYLSNSETFKKWINRTTTFYYFSPKEQEYFDRLYFKGGLDFKEKAVLNLKRYFSGMAPNP